MWRSNPSRPQDGSRHGAQAVHAGTDLLRPWKTRPQNGPGAAPQAFDPIVLSPCRPEETPVTLGTQTRTRFKTGETCVTTGRYRFDGYTDGTYTPSPTTEEMEIYLTRGETFPPIRSCNKGAWWRLIG